MPDYDKYAPYSELIINGSKMDSNFMSLIDEIRFEDESDLSSSLIFKMRYRQIKKDGINDDILSSKIISPGNLVILRGGYGNNIRDIGAGYITDITPDFTDNGEPTIEIVCYDLLQRLSVHKSDKGETFENFRDSQIASIIGERNGFSISLTDAASFAGIRKTKEKLTRTQKRGMSDLDFLKELAKLNSYDLYCKWDGKRKRFGLFFEPPKDRTKEVIRYVYGDGSIPHEVKNLNGELVGTLKSFKPTFSITSQFTKYKVYAWNAQGSRQIAHTIDMSEYIAGQVDLKFAGRNADELLTKNVVTSGAGVRKKAFGEVVEVVSTKIFKTESEAKTYLIMHMKKMVKDLLNGSAAVRGNEILQSRQIHKFDGLGAFFNGKYFISKVTHTFNTNGYDCQLQVRRALKELY